MSILPLIGSALEAAGGVASAYMAKKSADKQMDFQERMASTQHQREVNDLKAAGLNPILSGMGGSGAAAPSGAMFTPENPMRGMAGAALQTQLQKHQNRLMDEQANVAMSQANLNGAAQLREMSQLRLNDDMRKKVLADALKSINDSKVASAYEKNLNIDAGLKSFELMKSGKQRQIYSGQMGNVLGVADYIKTFLPFTK